MDKKLTGRIPPLRISFGVATRPGSCEGAITFTTHSSTSQGAQHEDIEAGALPGTNG
jgi:hypothetical protein